MLTYAKLWAIALGCCSLQLALARPAAAKTTTVKIATLAPEGSTWWKLFQLAAKDVKDSTDGRIRIRIYAGGVAGDEVDVVRKMRVGRLQGAAITSVGLAELQPAMLALQAPGLYRSWAELDHARDALGDKLATLLDEKGFRVLMWGDVGFNRIFAKVPVRTPADLASTKPWCWTQDGVYQDFYAAAGVNPVLTGVPDVLPALQTGRLDAYSTPPLVAVSFQWFIHAKYLLDLPQTVTIGAVVVANKAMEKLSEEDRNTVFAIGRKYSPKLAAAVRADNEKAMAAIRRAGIEVIEPDARMRAAWAEVATKAADASAGKVFPAGLLAEVRRAVADYRNNGGE